MATSIFKMENKFQLRMVFIDLQKVSFEQVQLAVLCPDIYFVPLNGYAGPYIESKFFKPRFVKRS